MNYGYKAGDNDTIYRPIGKWGQRVQDINSILFTTGTVRDTIVTLHTLLRSGQLIDVRRRGIIRTSIFTVVNWLIKMQDIRGFLADQDQAALLVNVKEGNRLIKKIQEYEAYKDMPKELKAEIREYFVNQYANANRMNKALANYQKHMASRQKW